MLYFLRMPNEAIHVGECSDERVNIAMNDLRQEYEPIFLKKIATIHGKESLYSDFRKEFSHLKIPYVSQYKPANKLIDFINEYHDPHQLFRRQEYTIGWEDVEASRPPNFAEPVEVALTRQMQADLLVEGAHQSISATEIIREVLDFYIKTRKLVRSGQDSAEQIDKFNRYMCKK
jgi:hypothetical protein